MKLKRLLLASGLALLLLGAQAGEINLALHRPAVASSQQKGFPATGATDGVVSRSSAWVSGVDARPPHVLEINLERYCTVGRMVVYTGIPAGEQTGQERGKAPGFWAMKNFKVQYWDDANWTDLPDTERTENRSDTLEFSFEPELLTFRVRLVSTDGEPIRINEFEVYGSEKAGMLAPVVAGAESAPAPQALQREMRVTVTGEVTGTTMKYVGYNQGYYLPGSNVSGWLAYSRVNSLRVWTSLDDYVPASAVMVDEGIATLDDFEACKAELRACPEGNRFIRWAPILENCRKEQFTTNSMVFEYVLNELKRLHIEPVLQVNSTDFDGSWSNRWKQWQRFYALAFYAARTGDVAMYAMHNEPNHRHAGPMKIGQYVDAMKVVSDAVHCAVQDVNRLYGKCLKARFVAPVTAGSNANWWAEVVRSIRVDYRGLPLDRDLIDIFSTHSYNLPAAGYVSKVSDIREIIVENHPLKRPLPIVYTETGRWMNAYLIDKEETMDSPSLFTEWAGEYTNNTLNQGYGMWAFKFANTTSGTYPRGIKSGHHFTWQGKRIVEDAYRNVALGKRAVAGVAGQMERVRTVTDGDKRDASRWVSPETDAEKCIEIDLGRVQPLGGAVVYTGSAYGVYTAPDRVRDFRLQYWDGKGSRWVDIPGAVERQARYAQSFFLFDKAVAASKVRFVSEDKGSIKVREIKLFDAESVGEIPSSYDISGIQRTGEVVRLFAKGFKEERPLLKTVKSEADNDVDAIACFSPQEMKYYVWLVQRKRTSNDLTLDLSSLKLPKGTMAIAELVGASAYGEVAWLQEVPQEGSLSFELPAQSVMLLTIPLSKNQVRTLTAVADAAVRAGSKKQLNYGDAKMMYVEMNASRADANRVSYIKFDLSDVNKERINAALLRLCGRSTSGTPYRFHVYALDNNDWDENTLNWQNAPNLERQQVRIMGVGNTAHVAGELAVDGVDRYHYLDVTDLLRRCRQSAITFVLIREVRQLGDDSDNGKSCSFSTKESKDKPELQVW